jgi:hypothetical protein
MPLRNRVDPSGTIFVTPARGTFMGNRGGVMHNANREIVRQYASRRWIACLLEFKGRRRTVMSPHRYTELFFLDEAVALSAGHRPCAECRRDRFNAFKEAWQRAHGLVRPPSANEMDLELHPTRIFRKQKVTCKAALKSLPDGCFVAIEWDAFLVLRDRLLRWTPEGYSGQIPRPKNLATTVLTPKPIVECLGNGYSPEIHTSAFDG